MIATPQLSPRLKVLPRPEIDEQLDLIQRAVLFLASRCDGAAENDKQGFNGTDAPFGHELAKWILSGKTLSPKQEAGAYKFLKKYWRQLKKAEPPIVLPKKFENRYQVIQSRDGWLVRNQSKGTEYSVAQTGDEQFSCECEAGQTGSLCGHVRALERHLGIEFEPFEQEIEAEFQVPQLGTVRDWVDDTDPKAAMVEVMGEEEPASTAITVVPVPAITVAQPDAGAEYPEIIKGIRPNPQQWAALQQMAHWLFETEEQMFCMKGYAGTGKSTTIQMFMVTLQEYAAKYNRRVKVAFTAPTNKAVKVLGRMSSKWGLEVDCLTCAKLFAIKPQRDGDKQIFVRDRDVEPSVDEYDLIVIDEGSMVDAALWSYFVEEQDRNLFGRLKRFLFMGDPAQLPPVNEAESKVFQDISQGFELTQVQRYGGAIGEMATWLRENLDSPRWPRWETQIDEGTSKGVYVLGRNDWESNILKAVQSERFANDADAVRILAWRNARVDELNRKVRNTIHGVNAPEYVPGERLVASEPWSGGGKTVLIPNASECEVYGAYAATVEGFPAWMLEVLCDTGMNYTVPVLKASAKAAFNKQQDEYRKGKQWGKFWNLREAFCWLNYAYALTVHKSQGSTFGAVFVDMADIAANRTKNKRMDGSEVWERNQLAYVAITRATDRVLLMQ